jgi:hypothetical protein
MPRILETHPFLARLTFAVALILAATFAHSQVPVAMAPPLHFQFLNSSGQPLANGAIYTYAAGTTTCLNTYVDATGTSQNSCVIPLDATGSPSNGSTQTGIFLANSSYKFVAFDVNNVFQWAVDRVTSYFGLLNSVNVWTGTNTFNDPITILATDDQLVMGASGVQTTLDFPPCTSPPCTLEFPNFSASIAYLNSPPLVTPLINGVEITGEPGTYISIGNNAGTGTTLNSLVKMVPNATAVENTATTDTFGAIGICVSNCAASPGTVVVQSTGFTQCTYDGTATNNDYVVISSSVAGDCHDAGATYPLGVQVIGLVFNGNSTPVGVFLFGPAVFAVPGSRGTPTFTAGGAMGVGGSVVCTPTFNCNDAGGTINVTTGTSASSGTVFTLTYGGTYNHSACVFQAQDSAASGIQIFVVPTPTNAILSAFSTSLSSSTLYQWNYICSFR